MSRRRPATADSRKCAPGCPESTGGGMGVRPRMYAVATENVHTFFPLLPVVGGTLLPILIEKFSPNFAPLEKFSPNSIRGARGAVGENWKLRFTNRSVRRRSDRFVNRSVRVLIEESYFVQEKTNKKLLWRRVARFVMVEPIGSSQTDRFIRLTVDRSSTAPARRTKVRTSMMPQDAGFNIAVRAAAIAPCLTYR